MRRTRAASERSAASRSKASTSSKPGSARRIAATAASNRLPTSVSLWARGLAHSIGRNELSQRDGVHVVAGLDLELHQRDPRTVRTRFVPGEYVSRCPCGEVEARPSPSAALPPREVAGRARQSRPGTAAAVGRRAFPEPPYSKGLSWSQLRPGTEAISRSASTCATCSKTQTWPYQPDTLVYSTYQSRSRRPIVTTCAAPTVCHDTLCSTVPDSA